MRTAASVILHPAQDDLLASTARLVIERSSLPDLTGCVVLLPELLFASDLRRHLLDIASARGYSALLGPHITTPELWLAEQAPLATAIPGRARRELLLVEAIRQHSAVFGDQDPWALADSLLTLFDELTLHRVPVDTSPADFRRRLQSAYGLTGQPPEPFDREARIVQRLWQAWHEQLLAHGLLDPAAALLQQFATLQAAPASHWLWFVGIDDPAPAMAEWIAGVLAAGHGQLLLHRPLQGAAAPCTAWQVLLDSAEPAGATEQDSGLVLDAIFSSSGPPLQARAAALREAFAQPPLAGRLQVCAAASAELEARAIDLQVRRWLLQGLQPLAVVTEDRRLGRRVRALLERAGISLRDPGGWALSTTRAAAALERWLQTVEEDFAHEPLLDTLKSPYTLPDMDRASLDNCVYRFETDIVRREQVASGLQRYRRQIELRQERLAQAWSAETATRLQQLLDRLAQASAPLLECLQGEHPPLQLLESLQQSLAVLGIWQAFATDQAGLRIQQEWRLLRDAARDSELRMDWNSFRAWLGAALEKHDFRPALASGAVWLLNLKQARLGRFAGIVIGACDSEYLPPAPARSPFFNDRVRSELGLPAWPERHQRQLQQFRALLESAPRVLLTWHREQNGELRTPAAWLARLEVFHRLAWAHELQDPTLPALLDHPGTQVAGHHPLPLPGVTGMPRAVLPAAALPQEISVSAHGTLIDCPYRFFAGSGLRLKAREEVKQALEKAEFGSLVHRALEIFHRGRHGYPEPLPQPLTAAQKESAVRQLEQVSRQLFMHDLEDNFEHRAWLRRWLVLIEPYIDWLIGHQASWLFADSEHDGQLQLADGHVLKGRIDRIDRGANGILIIDYKTGRAPDQAAVDSGEAVQLPSYALLLEHLPQAVAHVLIGSASGRTPVRNGSRLDETALAELSQAVRIRLETVLAEIAAGRPLPAWGDEDTCRYCDMDGLCRRQVWAQS